MESSTAKTLSTVLIIIVLVLVGGMYFWSQRSLVEEEEPIEGTNEPVACTMDAKQCPDGSYVGRTGPNCEFVCPDGSVSR